MLSDERIEAIKALAEQCPEVGIAQMLLDLLADRAALLDLLGQAARKGLEAREMFRRYGIVFDRWPVVEHLGAWTPGAVAALDAEIRWQGIAFSLYTDLAEMESAIDALGLDAQAEGENRAEQ